MKKIYSFLCLALLTMCLASCSTTSPSSLAENVYETPEEYGMTFTFKTETTCVLNNGKENLYGTYTLEGSEVKVNFLLDEEEMIFYLQEKNTLLMLDMGEFGKIPFYKK